MAFLNSQWRRQYLFWDLFECSILFRIFRELFVRFDHSIFFHQTACVAAMFLVRKSSKSEPSSRFFGRLKFSGSAKNFRKQIALLIFSSFFWGATRKWTSPATSSSNFALDYLIGARYDPWSSSWNRVPSWDGLRERLWLVPGGAQTFIWGGFPGCVCWPSPY